jgi:Zn-dependent peptidase ImmA (M78 family)
MKVKFLQESEIENSANLLLKAYEEQFDLKPSPPVPVDEIVECCLEIDFRFNNLETLLDRKDVLGAIWIEDKKIVIDESLDPSINPLALGRFNFTLGHEAGHWILHRHHFLALSMQGGLFEQKTEPSIVCRDGDNAPEEWQANTFSSYLLMPQQMIFNVWEEINGTLRPQYISEDFNTKNNRGDKNFVPTVEIARQMSKRFNVSSQAMQIKLKKLGLLNTSLEANVLFDKWQNTH